MNHYKKFFIINFINYAVISHSQFAKTFKRSFKGEVFYNISVFFQPVKLEFYPVLNFFRETLDTFSCGRCKSYGINVLLKTSSSERSNPFSFSFLLFCSFSIILGVSSRPESGSTNSSKTSLSISLKRSSSILSAILNPQKVFHEIISQNSLKGQNLRMGHD